MQQVSDTVAILNHGQLIAEAPIQELLAGNQGAAQYLVTLVVNPDVAQARVAAQPGQANTPPIGILGISTFSSLASQFGAIGMIIIAQDEIIREKQTGTAAWILSKPVSRQAFLLTKILANLAGSTLFILIMPMIVGYGEFALVNTYPQLLPYLEGAGVVFLGLLFYLTLTLMLGVLFDSRGAVLGITFGVRFGSLILIQFAPQLAYVLPANLQNIAGGLAVGQPMPAFALPQVAMTAVWSILFTGVALWRFLKLEF